MKAVILTAGLGTRLRPATLAMGKVLIPIYNKPMIFYAVSIVIESGIKDILIVCNSFDIPFYKNLFDNRYSLYGINIQFDIQKEALGTAHAFNIGKEFCKGDDVLLMFGDNIFLDSNLSCQIKKVKTELTGVTIFAKSVNAPNSFGIIETDKNNNILSIEEKPTNPKSDLAATGLMLYTADVFNKIERLKPSVRGEYEITDLNNLYLTEDKAKVCILNKNCTWLDTGTHDSLLEGSIAVKNYELENGIYGSPEISLFKAKEINLAQLENLIEIYHTEYKQKILNTIKSL